MWYAHLTLPHAPLKSARPVSMPPRSAQVPWRQRLMRAPSERQSQAAVRLEITLVELQTSSVHLGAGFAGELHGGSAVVFDSCFLCFHRRQRLCRRSRRAQQRAASGSGSQAAAPHRRSLRQNARLQGRRPLPASGSPAALAALPPRSQRNQPLQRDRQRQHTRQHRHSRQSQRRMHRTQLSLPRRSVQGVLPRRTARRQTTRSQH